MQCPRKDKARCRTKEKIEKRKFPNHRNSRSILHKSSNICSVSKPNITQSGLESNSTSVVRRHHVVGRRLQAHWVHVRSPRSVRGVRQTLRRSHGHLVGHRGRGHSLSGSSGGVVERWRPWIELVDWRMYRQCCWAGLFGGSEWSLAQIVERLGRRGEIIRVV